jgi:hypothetical protein
MDGRLFTALSKTELSDIVQAKSEMSARFLQVASSVMPLGARAFRAAAAPAGKPHNVVGVGIDEKYVDGVPVGIRAVKFLVRSKAPPSAVINSEMLPKSVGGVITDVEEVGNIIPFARKKAAAAPPPPPPMPNPKGRFRPIQPGSSAGFEDPAGAFVMAGTFGLLVKDGSGVKYILSNNHVLANESGVDADGNAHVGLQPGQRSIFQPGLLDGGNVPTDKVGELTRWIDLHADRADNKVDGAIARVAPKTAASKTILFIGDPQGTIAATVDMIVHKFGRTTSYRAGRVSSVSFDVSLDYVVGKVVFQDQIAIRGLNNTAFSAAGDSGSAILERATNKVTGLLFAGATNSSITFANHIEDVLTELNVRLA